MPVRDNRGMNISMGIYFDLVFQVINEKFGEIPDEGIVLTKGIMHEADLKVAKLYMEKIKMNAAELIEVKDANS